MSSSSSSSNKLHPIYVALENGQFSRAIKLGLAQPKSNKLAQALLAHAYAKMGQRYKALLCMQTILEVDGANKAYFPELRLEIQYALERRQEQQQQASQSAASQAASPQKAGASSGKKAGRKGKRKGGGGGARQQQQPKQQPPQPAAPAADDDWDLIDQLDTPPTLPDKWDALPPSSSSAEILTDETLLSTVTMTLVAHLRMPLTAHQLYSWAAAAVAGPAAAAAPVDPAMAEVVTRKAFLSGLAVLVAPQYQHISGTILAHMQVLALQLARIQQQLGTGAAAATPAATAWAAQTALWQLQYKDSNNSNNNSCSDKDGDEAAKQAAKEQQRLAMLPRLAESLALKCVASHEQPKSPTAISNQTEPLMETEDFLLYMRTLEHQEKYQEQVTALEERLKKTAAAAAAAAKGGQQQQPQPVSAPPRQTLLDLKVTALMKLKQYTEAKEVLETELLEESPDDWRCWKRLLDCAVGITAGDTAAAAALVQPLIDSKTAATANQKYPVRGPHLMRVELARLQLEASSSDSGGDNDDIDGNHHQNNQELVQALLQSIQQYGNVFADRVTCTFSDLAPYLKQALQACHVDEARSLLQWAADKRNNTVLEDGDETAAADASKARRAQLRAYIFAVQVTYLVVVQFPQLRESDLPDWQQLAKVWKAFESSSSGEDDNMAQKESRPADELVLLAVQQLFCNDNKTASSSSAPDTPAASSSPSSSTLDLLDAACLLESAIRCSPYNAYLKITAMFVYSELNAVARAFELSRELQLKHIQHESCAYLILPLLRSGGFYRETISVCQEILRLQTKAIRDASEYASRAMENGTISKADEFIAFQRDRMNPSLTTLEAKGLILDSAPMFVLDERRQDSLGAMHGIVGGDADVDRASEMVAEAHNPSAAFSLLRLMDNNNNNGNDESTEASKDGNNDNKLVDRFSENRDFGIFSHEILIERSFDSSGQILKDSLRRGHHHRLLIRAALCMEATKGPKKGKVTKSSNCQEKRCRSLLAAVVASHNNSGNNINNNIREDGAYQNILSAMHEMCSSIAAFGAGIYRPAATAEAAQSASATGAADTLEEREKRITGFLHAAADSLVQGRTALGSSSGSSSGGLMSVSRASRLLPDCIIPCFALFRMCAKAADLYGWGPRKYKTKVVAAAVAQLASKLLLIITDMMTCLERLPDPEISSAQYDSSSVSELVEESIYRATVSNIVEGQELTRGRICNVLDGMKKCLDAFQEDANK